MNPRSEHWQRVYEKSELQFSWYQAYPETSVRLIRETNCSLDEPIIDVGGGDSHLVDALLQLGYSDLWVLDISSRAIERAKQRLGVLAKRIKWIVSDVVNFSPSEKFAVWHDRATLHFLVDEANVDGYRENVSRAVTRGGTFILGAFSAHGPDKCSGLPVKKYTELQMVKTFEGEFRKERCFEELHQTPFNTTQAFQFCLFNRC